MFEAVFQSDKAVASDEASDEPVTLTTFASEQAEGPEENITLLLNEKENDDEVADEFDSSSDEEIEA